MVASSTSDVASVSSWIVHVGEVVVLGILQQSTPLPHSPLILNSGGIALVVVSEVVVVWNDYGMKVVKWAVLNTNHPNIYSGVSPKNELKLRRREEDEVVFEWEYKHHSKNMNTTLRGKIVTSQSIIIIPVDKQAKPCELAWVKRAVKWQLFNTGWFSFSWYAHLQTWR